MPIAAGTPSRSAPSKATSLFARAASVPLPIAQPTSAAASAGASFVPSPTITTRCEPDCKEWRASSLSAGVNEARASSMPSSSAIACTAGALSPLTIELRRPMSFKRATAEAASVRSGVLIAMAPTTSPARVTTTTVSPRASRHRPRRTWRKVSAPRCGEGPLPARPPTSPIHPDPAAPGPPMPSRLSPPLWTPGSPPRSGARSRARRRPPSRERRRRQNPGRGSPRRPERRAR